jgi:glyoxylase-like metal-dependent hydrolase (beta-lactamase superfamily II)
MANSRIVTIDLNFQNKTNAIASYLIRDGDAVVLIETGPGSTLPALEAALAAEGLSTRDVTHVLVTHIHLDHSGAAGFLAKQGAQIYVHPNGAAHLVNPEKLIASATRIYGDRMDQLWGEILPVPQNQLTVPNDAEEIVIGNCDSFPSTRLVMPSIIIPISLKMFVSAATWAGCVFRAMSICARRCRRLNFTLGAGVKVLRG